MSALFQPLTVGDLVLPNRVVMAPLTRLRATLPGHVPNALMTEYYAQRASAGLILTEATPVTPWGVGYEGVPGIWSAEQTQGWKHVTRAVHERGGRIALQLWHVGRISDPQFLNGEPPVAPSAIAPKGHVSLLRPERPYVTPRALERHEIADVIEDFRRGAQNALEAGFDGVEIHGANGYLLDQFLQDSTNRREDHYGGSIEPDLAVLRSFMYPSLNALDLGAMVIKGIAGDGWHFPCVSAPPMCTLVYGPLSFDCVMEDLDIKITDFQENLAPLRAEVKVSLAEQTNSTTPISETLTRLFAASRALDREGIGDDFAAASPIIVPIINNIGSLFE